MWYWYGMPGMGWYVFVRQSMDFCYFMLDLLNGHLFDANFNHASLTILGIGFHIVHLVAIDWFSSCSFSYENVCKMMNWNVCSNRECVLHCLENSVLFYKFCTSNNTKNMMNWKLS